MEPICTETASIDQLRAWVMNEIGNTELFDACATDATKRDFVADYVAESQKQDEANENYYDQMMRGD